MSQAPIVFDEKRWKDIIQKPDWYLEFNDFAKGVGLKSGSESAEIKSLKIKVRRFFEHALQEEGVSLAKNGYNFDSERQSVDTIVIHHTSAQPGYKFSYLNAVQLLNIYVPAYADGVSRGQPIWSGHFHKGRQVFWGYHWLMRMDGGFERLLDDDQIGWYAGNWDINRRSVAICLDNDYEKQNPTDEILQKLAGFIKENYPGKKIIGHCEARQSTTCPGTNFLDDCKPVLLRYLS